MKKSADAKRQQQPVYSVGEKRLLDSRIYSNGFKLGKLEERFLGPYIVKQVTDKTVTVNLGETNRRDSIFNEKWVKKYYD
jgi:hypothetical protein